LADTPGPYLLQAEIAACHARARQAADTDWRRIAAIYGLLAAIEPSPVIELNRAVAVGMAEGPAAGLEIVDGLLHEPALRNYHLLPSVRGDLLEKLGRLGEAEAEFRRAAGMTRNAREQALLTGRAEALAGRPEGKRHQAR
jgi:predicted RNA polymerase sigma factor